MKKVPTLRFVPLYSLSLAACLVPGHAFAQTTESAAAEGVAPAPEPQAQVPANADEIVVTAQKRAERLSDVPIAITAFSGDRLAQLPVKDLQDFTAIVPSLRVTTPGNAALSALSLRGVGQRDINVHSEGTIALFIDGAYVSFPSSLAQPLFDVERVEVLKGPQSTLFGRNANGGLISVVSKRPTQDPNGYFTAQYGSYNELKLEGAIGAPITSTISTRLSASYTRSDGYVKNSAGPDLNANDSLSVRLQLLFEPTDNFSFLLSGRTWQFFNSPGAGIVPSPFIQDATGTIRKPTSAAEYASFCAALNPFAPPPPGAFQNGSCFAAQPDRFRGTYNQNVRFEEDYNAITGTAEWALGDDITLTSISDYQEMSMDFLSDLDATAQPIAQNEVNIHKSKQFSQEVRLNGSLDALQWVAGVYYVNIDHDARVVVDLTNHPAFGFRLPADYTQSAESYAAFGQIDWKWAPHWTLSLGARALHDKKVLNNVSTCVANPAAPPGLCDFLGAVVFPGALAFNRSFRGEISEGNWSGRAALRFEPTDDLMFYASVTRGVKAAGFNSGAAEFYPLSAVPFDKEVLISYEAGLKASLFDRRLTLDGSVFYYDYNGYQTFSPSSDGGLRIFNVDGVIKGAELAVTARPTDGLTLSAAATYLDTKQKDVPLPNGTFRDFQIPDAPKFSMVGEIRYETAVTGDDKLAFQLNGTYVGERSISAIDFPDQRLGSYHKFDARVSYTFSGGRWQAAAFANNFTDEVIISTRVDFTTLTGNSVDSIDRPRWFGGSLTYRY